MGFLGVLSGRGMGKGRRIIAKVGGRRGVTTWGEKGNRLGCLCLSVEEWFMLGSWGDGKGKGKSGYCKY